MCYYSKTPIYCGVRGKGNICGKSGSAVNRGFVWFTSFMFSPIWGKGNGSGKLGFAVNRGSVYRGFTVFSYLSMTAVHPSFHLHPFFLHSPKRILVSMKEKERPLTQ